MSRKPKNQPKEKPIAATQQGPEVNLGALLSSAVTYPTI